MQPNLLFIGQAHSGSTSLSEFMDLHPKVSSGSVKEHHYFDRDSKRKTPGRKVNPCSANSFSKYLDQFCVSCNTTVAFDATQEYIDLGSDEYAGRKDVEKIRTRLGGNLKIMLQVRDPVDLIFSLGYDANTTLSIVEALTVWRKVFPRKENWLFLESDEWFNNPEKTLNKVFKFVGVESLKESLDEKNDKGEHMIDSGRRRNSKKATSAQRKAYWSVKERNEDHLQLKKLTGLKLNWKKS